MLKEIASLYGLPCRDIELIPIGAGLIHQTWKMMTGGNEFILQQVNSKVFRHPTDIAENIMRIGRYLNQNNPDYKFISPLSAINGEKIIYLNDGGYYRIFPFVKGSHSKFVVKQPEEAYEAALQFGRFTRLLADFDCEDLHLTIPCFHDLNLRYRQFLQAVEKTARDKRQKADILIKKIINDSWIVTKYQSLISDPALKMRVIHHDTKISNVLFDNNDKGICVIDLDTVMPGYFISDVGDMMRTYLSPASEEETEWHRIEVRKEIYLAIIKGYCEEMNDSLTELEKQSFFFAGQFMIYMQGIRFLTDYLQHNRYYGEKYPDQNLFRARNQLVLLEKFSEMQ